MQIMWSVVCSESSTPRLNSAGRHNNTSAMPLITVLLFKILPSLHIWIKASVTQIRLDCTGFWVLANSFKVCKTRTFSSKHPTSLWNVLTMSSSTIDFTLFRGTMDTIVVKLSNISFLHESSNDRKTEGLNHESSHVGKDGQHGAIRIANLRQSCCKPSPKLSFIRGLKACGQETGGSLVSATFASDDITALIAGVENFLHGPDLPASKRNLYRLRSKLDSGR